MRSILFAVCCGLLLAGCETVFDLNKIRNKPTNSPTSNPTNNPAVVQKDDSGKKYRRGNKSPYVVLGETYEVMPDSLGYLEIGIASWYGKKFHGRMTSNGETYDMYKYTAAHKSLPLPTIAKVTNLDNGESVVVRVNDRGPFHDDRIIDLSYQTALKLGFSDKGTAPVVVEALDERNYPGLSRELLKDLSFYLQIGEFDKINGAEVLKGQIEKLIRINGIDSVAVNILQSEVEAGSPSSVMHKLWIGPIATNRTREHILRIIESAGLGVPHKVEV